MSIERLLRVVPPPAEPFEPFDGPWEPVEAFLGTPLPADYKELARRYGRGRFVGSVVVNLPGSRERRGSLEGELHMARDMINLGMSVPYPAWPEAGGLLNIGLTDFNDRLFWLPRGRPEDWRIVVWDRALQNLEVFDCSLTDFLAGLASGTIQPEGLPEGMASTAPGFEPFKAAARQTRSPRRRGIEALTQIVPPPEKPFQPFLGPWGPVEAYLGTELPQDYKDFARLYGSGLFMNLFTVYVPNTTLPYANLLIQARDIARYFEPPEEQPYPIWPRTDGLIVAGGSDNADQFYWSPQGAPDEWTIVFQDGAALEPFEEFDYGLAEFLAALASGVVFPRGYTEEDFEPCGPLFQPYSV
ncbi:SMI1/KNR4 family protein [Phenylobacterium sp.]|uniref:SMI1/KNR4 family protein n=1 Tax=Phenylobacterium sp. TaxID=1871053 RepID=UPI0025CC7A0D|nr:SMI1/KNR4 family protein [Phenylobacterium sp.]